MPPLGSFFFSPCRAPRDSVTTEGQLFSLRELLNTPMQRILKYPLLVKQLFKGTVRVFRQKFALEDVRLKRTRV
jgi:hypothetical protein